jgi:hypothetical protein
MELFGKHGARLADAQAFPVPGCTFDCKIIRGPQPLCFLSGFFLSLLYPVSRSRPSHSPMELFGKHGARLADAQPSPYQVALLMQDHPWSTAPVLFVRFLPFFAISGLPPADLPTAQWNYLASMVQDWQMPSLPRTRLHF